MQRYLSGKSVRESQLGMIFNGLLKVPMQFFILLVGVLVFVFYQFNASPLNFNPNAEKAVLESPHAEEYRTLQSELKVNKDHEKVLTYQFIKSKNATEKTVLKQQLKTAHQKGKQIRAEGKKVIERVGQKVETNDKDYVFIHFILENLPRGLIGLLLAVIFSAAMSSTAS